MVSQKYHTPFCSKNCKIEHHDLVTVLCLDSSQKSDELPDLLKECIESYGRSWDHNSQVPDPLEDLRCPLIYLASAFGKAGLVKALLQDNFDPRALNSYGETALHGAVGYIYRTGSLQSRGLKVASTLGPIKNRRKAFERVLVALTDSDPKIIFVQDNEGNTVFHAAAENIWNDRQNDRQGRSATFFQFCMSTMVNRVLELEEVGKVTRTETLEGLNAQNNDGDTIFHIFARDYAYGFKTMKQILKKFFPGQVPSKVNKENQTVAGIALERNRKRATQVFPEFLEKRASVITIDSGSEISDNQSPTPSTSRGSEEFATHGEQPPHMIYREPPTVISDSDVPQITHTIDEEETSSNEVIAASKETVAGSASEASAAPLASNPGQHNLLTVSTDSSLGKPSQMEVPSFLSLSEKSNLVVSPFDSLINAAPGAPIDAEVMYVTETIQSTVRVTSEETTTLNNASETGDALHAVLKRAEVSDTRIHGTDNDPSDPKTPFTITLPSNDSNVSGTSTKNLSSAAPPSEERVAVSSEEAVACSANEPEHTVAHSITVSNSNGDSCEGNISATDASHGSEAQAAQAEIFAVSHDDTIELHDSQVPFSVSPDVHNTQVPSGSQVGPNSRGRTDVVASNQQPSNSEVPQTSRGKQAAGSSQAKATVGSVARDLFDPLREQIPESSEYTHLYHCGMLDSPTLSSRNQQKIGHDSAQSHKSVSVTSLASASTESIHSESFEPLDDVNDEGSDERSTILKCITDNSFLEFIITEGLDLDARSKQGVVDVVMAQYSNKLSRVESTIPKLAAHIRETETVIGQQKEKVKQLQEEIEFVKGEIVKNENLLHGFIHEQQGLSKQRKALKRKVVRCEGTMKQLLGNAKKPRLE